MVRLYTLLSIVPHLPLPIPYAHAALLPRVDVPSESPGVVSTVPATKPAIKVTPFKQPRHGFPKLHRTLSVVKRLVEENGFMVEVSEEALRDVLDQINKLQDQVSSMFSPDSQNKGSPQPGVGQPGTGSGQLPSGSSNTPSNENLPAELPAQPNRTGLPDSVETSGPSKVPIVSDTDTRSNLPGQPNIPNTIVPPLPSSSFNLPSTPEQPGPAGQGQSDDQADTVANELPGNSGGEPANLPTDVPGNGSNDASTDSTETQPSGVESAQQPKESLPRQPGEEPSEPKVPSEERLGVQPNGQSVSLLDGQPTSQLNEPASQTANQQPQGQAELHSGTAPGSRPTGSPNNVPEDQASVLPNGQANGEPSGLPGGVFVEDPDNVPGSSPDETTSIGQAQVPGTGTQQPSQTIDPSCLEDEVSGQPNVRRNINCVPGVSLSATDPGRVSSVMTTHGSATQKALGVQTDLGTQSTLGIQTAINAEATLESPTALGSPTAQDIEATLDVQTAFDTQTTPDPLAALNSQEVLNSEATLAIEGAFNTQAASDAQTAFDTLTTISIQAQLDTRTAFDTGTASDTQATLDAQAAPDTQTVSGLGGVETSQQTTEQPATTSAASSIDNSPVSVSTESPATLTTAMAVQQTLREYTTTRETQQLRTLVFTSVLTRSSRVKWTTTHTEFFHIGQPTESPTIPGLVFIEDPDMTLHGDEGPTISSENSGSSADESISQSIAPSTAEASGSTSFQESGLDIAATLLTESIITRISTTSMIWSGGSTPATAVPRSSPRPLLPPNAVAANATYTTPASGFRTMAKQTRSLMEREEMM